ncbi:Phenylalanine--tRNA ligase beta subunit [compost metagenome]
MHEVITYSFTHSGAAEAFPGLYPTAKPVSLAMPMSEERSSLRTGLLPQLLEVVSYNRNRNNDNVAIFEIGKVFITEQESLVELPEEKLLLSVVLTGKRRQAQWSQKAESYDFYDLKGIFDRLTAYLGIEGVTYSAAQAEGFHPGRTAELHLTTAEGRILIGRMGQLHPTLQQQRDLEDTYAIEVELQPLIAAANESIDYKLLPKYPAISRDLAVVVDVATQVGSMEQSIREVAGELLESIQVFDIYTGERLGTDRKSVAFALVYRHADRTLLDEEVTELHGKVVQTLEQQYGAELRK